jgi:hypothetical protein
MTHQRFSNQPLRLEKLGFPDCISITYFTKIILRFVFYFSNTNSSIFATWAALRTIESIILFEAKITKHYEVIMRYCLKQAFM